MAYNNYPPTAVFPVAPQAYSGWNQPTSYGTPITQPYTQSNYSQAMPIKQNFVWVQGRAGAEPILVESANVIFSRPDLNVTY